MDALESAAIEEKRQTVCCCFFTMQVRMVEFARQAAGCSRCALARVHTVHSLGLAEQKGDMG